MKQLNASTADVAVSVPVSSQPSMISADRPVEAEVTESPEKPGSRGTQKRLFRESVWVVGGRVLGIATAIGLNVVLVRVLPPADVGVFFVLGSIITFAAIVAMFGTHTGLVRFVSERIGVGDAEGAKAALRQGAKFAAIAISVGSVLTMGFLYFAGEPLFGLKHLEVIAPLVAGERVRRRGDSVVCEPAA